jgi:hypothetical protein
MNNKELFKQAILDAKSVRDAALANAKKTLEESLTPQLQSMLAKKLQEMESGEDLDESEEVDESVDQSGLDEELDLDEVLAELELDETTSTELKENYGDQGNRGFNQTTATVREEEEDDFSSEEEPESDDDGDTDEPEDDFNAPEPEGGEEGISDEESISNLTVGDIKDLLRDVIASELAGSEGDAVDGDMSSPDDLGGEPGPEMGAGMHDEVNPEGGSETEDEDIDLDEFLSELEQVHENDDIDEHKFGSKEFRKVSASKMHENDEIDEHKFGSKEFRKVSASKMHENDEVDEGKFGNAVKKVGSGIKNVADKAKKFYKDEVSPSTVKKGGKYFGKSVSHETNPFAESQELNEAIKTIKTLRKELNEVNLLNAKLLYVNKVFKAKNLTEAQKAKVIITFDKANSVNEAKLIYTTLIESFNGVKSTNKKPIAESRGFASKPAGVAPTKNAIVDSNVERWQFLAGIKKTQL